MSDMNEQICCVWKGAVVANDSGGAHENPYIGYYFVTKS